MKCEISQMTLVRLCFYGCCSLKSASATSEVDVCHAIKAVGKIAQSEMDMELCLVTLCPSTQVSADETVSFQTKCAVRVQENNMTHNTLNGDEMLALFGGCVTRSPIIFGNIVNDTCGEVIYEDCKLTLELCNFLSNKKSNHILNMICNYQPLTLCSCVISFNEYPNFCLYTTFDISKSFLCSNSFPLSASDFCTETIQLRLGRFSGNCALGSYLFTSNQQTVIEFQLLVLLILLTGFA